MYPFSNFAAYTLITEHKVMPGFKERGANWEGEGASSRERVQ